MALLALALALSVAAPALGEGAGEARDGAATEAVPDAMRCFVDAYPDTVCGATPSALVLCDGARITWDDGEDKPDHDALLARADLEDSMRMRYRPGRDYPVPAYLFEPGRVRHTPLFLAMYGADREAVRATLDEVDWLPRSGGGRVKMTRVNGVADALRRVSDDIERELSPELRELAASTSGTFVWRKVRGTSRPSMHSFAIAIDVAVPRSDYWRWNKPDAAGRFRYKNRFPLEIVEIFERHGFIWGGKWYHFDTMHFEYRPEYLVAPCVDGPSPLRR